MAANSHWQAEFAGALQKQPDTILETIVTPEAIDASNAFPRQIIVPFQWGFDFHLGNCTDDITLAVTVDLARLKPDVSLSPAQQGLALQSQYEGVLGVYQNIFEEFSESSYQSGAPLAQVKVECDTPFFDSLDEHVDESTDGDQLIVYWCNFVLTTKTG